MRPASLFGLTLLALLAATWLARVVVPEIRSRAASIALAQRPPDPTFYLAHDRGGHIDHHVIYWGIDDDVVSRMKQADVLLLGSSRLMFALRARVLDPWADARDIRYYALGFGFREGDAFPLAIIRKFDLHPRLVVVNVDGFFGRGASEWADRVMRDSAFGARKRQFEGEAAHEVRRVVHRLVPNWIDLFGRPGFRFGHEFIAYRSRRNGIWVVSPWPQPTMSSPARDFEREPVTPREAAAARAFKTELDARGARLVLTYVPTPEDMGGNPVALGQLLGVPVAGLNVDGLSSHDGSHLSEASAVTWSQRLADDLAPLLRPVAPQ